MPRRRQSKKVEESATSSVELLFNGANWQTNRLYRDYGIDLHVKIFDDDEEGAATPWEFYVQIKGRSSVKVVKEAASLQIDREHLRLWSQVSLPVILVLFDTSSTTAYWLGIRSYLRDCFDVLSEPRASVSLSIPRESVLSQSSLERLRRHVRNEILYLHAQAVVSTIRWWVVRHGSSSSIGLWSQDEGMLPIDHSAFPSLPFPQENLDSPVLAYCWGCGEIWWMDESDTWLGALDEEDDMEYLYPPMYIGQSLQPDAHFVDPDGCPRCCSGEGLLDLCVKCGAAFPPFFEECQSREEWEGTPGDEVPVSYEEAKELCSDCTSHLWQARSAPKRSRDE